MTRLRFDLSTLGEQLAGALEEALERKQQDEDNEKAYQQEGADRRAEESKRTAALERIGYELNQLTFALQCLRSEGLRIQK